MELVFVSILNGNAIEMDKNDVLEIGEEGPFAFVAFKATSISSSEGIAAAAGRLKKYICEQHPKKIIFDFSGVKFFSSQVLGLLLDVRSKLKEYGGEVVISAINPRLYRVFKITNLDSIFRFFPDKLQAIEALTGDGAFN